MRLTEFQDLTEVRHDEVNYQNWGVITPEGKMISGDEYPSRKALNHPAFLVALGLEDRYDLLGNKSMYARYGMTKEPRGWTLYLTIPKKAPVKAVLQAWNKLPIADVVHVIWGNGTDKAMDYDMARGYLRQKELGGKKYHASRRIHN